MLQEELKREPVREIFLKGTFEEMGVQYIDQLGPEILKQLKILEQDLKLEDPVADRAFRTQAEGVVKGFIAAHKYPEALMRMYRTIVETEFSVSNGLTLEKLIFLDLAVLLTSLHPKVIPPELLAKYIKPDSCSYLAITQGGKPEIAAGRNFDWPEYAMHALTALPLVLHLDCTEQDYPNYVTMVSHPGSICGFTFFTNNSLSWSLNSASLAMAINLPGGIRFDVPYVAATGLIDMFQARDFQDLLKRTQSSPSDYPGTINIAGRTIQETAAVEKCPIDVVGGPGAFKNATRTYGSTNTKNPEDVINNLGYAHTNMVHAKGWKKHLGHSPNQIAVSFPFERLQNLRKLILNENSRAESLMKSMQAYLSYRIDDAERPGAAKIVPKQPPYEEDISATYYSTAYCPYKGKLKVTFQQASSADAQEGILTSPTKIKTCRPN
ncbi:MAG: hypothetical protein U1E78_08465 [Gammaproteobacteria bacterium]